MKAAPKSLLKMLVLIILASGLGACSTRSDIEPECPICPEQEQKAEPTTWEPEWQRTPWNQLNGWQADKLEQAWPALRQSCSALGKQPAWREVCERVRSQDESMPSTATARAFLQQHFQAWQIGNVDDSQHRLVTGYFEPLIQASRTASAAYRWPVHGVPDDLLVVDLADVYPELKRMRLRGRVQDNRIVPYWTRGQIASLGSEMPAPVLFWAADPIELFFLHVQGSGQLALPDGSRTRIGYAEHNGHPYRSIGRWLVAQDELALHEASMQGIKQWARNNPERLQELLAVNPSYVFFRELAATDQGPIGAQGVPLTAQRSVAIDPEYVPMGAPVFLDTTRPNSEEKLQRLVIAQDTGGAIKGPMRVDFFWGLGSQAGELAGKMRQTGRVWVLLPQGTTPQELLDD